MKPIAIRRWITAFLLMLQWSLLLSQSLLLQVILAQHLGRTASWTYSLHKGRCCVVVAALASSSVSIMSSNPDESFEDHIHRTNQSENDDVTTDTECCHLDREFGDAAEVNAVTTTDLETEFGAVPLNAMIAFMIAQQQPGTANHDVNDKPTPPSQEEATKLVFAAHERWLRQILGNGLGGMSGEHFLQYLVFIESLLTRAYTKETAANQSSTGQSTDHTDGAAAHPEETVSFRSEIFKFLEEQPHLPSDLTREEMRIRASSIAGHAIAMCGDVAKYIEGNLLLVENNSGDTDFLVRIPCEAKRNLCKEATTRKQMAPGFISHPEKPDHEDILKTDGCYGMFLISSRVFDFNPQNLGSSVREIAPSFSVNLRENGVHVTHSTHRVMAIVCESRGILCWKNKFAKLFLDGKTFHEAYGVEPINAQHIEQLKKELLLPQNTDSDLQCGCLGIMNG
jgi:hypothetical protein